MFFSVLSAESEPNCNSVMNVENPSSRCASRMRRRTVSGLPTMITPCLSRFSTLRPAPMIDCLPATTRFHRVNRGVTGREEHADRHLQGLVEQELDRFARLVHRLLVGVGDVARRRPA